jgi:predicted nucleic acid-binding protein
VTVLVDTTLLVDHLRDRRMAVELLSELLRSDDVVWAATPSRTEVIAGIRERERGPMARLFGLLSWVEVDAEIADAAGELSREFRRSHPAIDTADFLIAAAALSIGARLVTSNVKHYPMFPGLESAY